MTPQDYILKVKQTYGAQPTRDGTLIRDLNDKVLLKKMLERYPADSAGITGLDSYLQASDKAAVPDTHPFNAYAGTKLGQVMNSIGDRVGAKVAEQWDASGKKIAGAVSEGAQKFAADGSQNGMDSAGQTIKKTGDLLEAGLGAASGAVQGLFAPLTGLINAGIDSVSNNKAVQDFASGPAAPVLDAASAAVHPITEWAKAHPEAAKNLTDAITVATAGLGEGAAGTLGATDLGALGKTTGKAMIDSAGGALDAASAAMPKIPSPLEAGSKLADSVRTTLAKRAVDPRLAESAGRLTQTAADAGTTVANDVVPHETPSALYDKFYNQEQKFKGDIKHDTALGMVGQDIGTAFDKVQAQRREVGAVMGDELKKVGNIKANIQPEFSRLETELKNEQGLTYSATGNKGKGKLTPVGSQSSMTKEDTGLLEKYIKDLNTLGANPTISDLDAFMKRVPQELDVYKAGNGIMQTTNAERIIKKSLAGLRDQFDPIKSGHPELANYAEARQAYSELSNFVNEGGSFLGKKTASGDYSRDASVAKSAVQSILNGGKKDWLIKLEGLTGYPALDETVVALQAMKDAGNFRGLSLLETLSGGDGSIPLSKSGIVNKILDYAVKKAGTAVTGDSAAQTRQFLKSIEDGTAATAPGAPTAVPSTPTAPPKAKAGEPSTPDAQSHVQSYAPTKEHIDNLSASIASAIPGAEVKMAPLKTAERTLEKAVADYGGDLSKVRDLARNTIVVPTREGITKALELLKKEGNIVGDIKDFIDVPRPNGYRHILANVKAPDGKIGEIQITYPDVFKAKINIGDKIYEQMRSLEAHVAKEARAFTSKEAAELKSLAAQMWKLYSDAAPSPSPVSASAEG